MGNPQSIDTDVRLASMLQIHSAIDHMHRGDFECAITLAAAAEGVLPEPDEEHFRQKVNAVSKGLPIDETGAKGGNDVINWLKHGTLNGQRLEKATISELEMIVAIYRAISKYSAQYDDMSPQMKEFCDWARTHRQKDG